MKVCSKCKVEKEYSEFYKNKNNKDGYNGRCKRCIEQYKKEYRDNHGKVVIQKYREIYKVNNKDKMLEYQRKYQKIHKDKISQQNKIYKLNNKEKVKEWAKKRRQTDKYKDYRKEYYQSNKTIIREKEKIYYEKNIEKKEKKLKYRRDYYENNKGKLKDYKKTIAKRVREQTKARYKTDELFALTASVRNRIYIGFKNKGYKKTSHTHQLLGCDWNTLKTHIESQFTDGMNWENRSDWHIDHIIPYAIADTKDEIEILSYYENLQPLWAEDNLRKSGSF